VQMSRERNIKKKCFSRRRNVSTVWQHDIAGQDVPESGTGRTECSVADSCTPHSRYLQSMCPRWSEPMPARHVSYTELDEDMREKQFLHFSSRWS